MTLSGSLFLRPEHEILLGDMESLDLGVRGDDGDTGTLLTITLIDGSVQSKKKIFLVPFIYGTKNIFYPSCLPT